MKKNTIILYAGKKFGCLALNYMAKFYPPDYVVPNLDDNGKDSIIHDSIIKLAKKLNIKIINNKKLKKLQTTQKLEIDYIFCAGSTIIIPKDVLKSCKYGAINFHPSLLPKYRGRYSNVHALFNGEEYTGVTCHWIGTGIDKGNIISQKKIKIKKFDTAKDLYEKFTSEAFKLFKISYHKILDQKKIKSKKIIAKTKYEKKHLPNRGKIDWKWNGKKILNFIKSMTYEPFEPPSFYLGKKKYFIIEHNLIKKKFYKSPK